MLIRPVGVAIVVAAAWFGCSSRDRSTESARARILALDPSEAARIVAFCKSWRQEGPLRVEQFPSELPVQPTSAIASGGVITFEWWNNSRAEEDEPHPGFELICSEHAVPRAKPIAAGLWYRDSPMNSP